MTGSGLGMTGAAAPFAARVERDLVVVQGPDATSFLQSLVSQDLEPVAVGESVPTLLLQPQGKVLVAFNARRDAGDTWLCVCEGGFGSALADGLGRFKIRVKADIEIHPVAAVAVRGLEPPASVPGCVVVPVGWGGVPAYDALGAEDAVAAFTAGLGIPVVSADEYEQARIGVGEPRMGLDIDDRTIPQEAGLEVGAVSFTKGCFVGQELVCRIDSRGHVNRQLRRLRGLDAGVGVRFERDATLVVEGREMGTITSAGTGAALAMIRREVSPGATGVVGETQVVVEELRPG